jgi:hypothetical protein
MGRYKKNFPKKQERFWIENCEETKVPEGQTCQMKVLITRVELTDDHLQQLKQSEPAKDHFLTLDVVNWSSQATAETAVVCVKRSKGAKRPIKKVSQITLQKTVV